MSGGADDAVSKDCTMSTDGTTVCSYDMTGGKIMKECTKLPGTITDFTKEEVCVKLTSGQDICYCKIDNCNKDCKPGTCIPNPGLVLLPDHEVKEICPDAKCATGESTMSNNTKSSTKPKMSVASKTSNNGVVSLLSTAAKAGSGSPPIQGMTTSDTKPGMTTSDSSTARPFYVWIVMFLIISMQFD